MFKAIRDMFRLLKESVLLVKSFRRNGSKHAQQSSAVKS